MLIIGIIITHENQKFIEILINKRLSGKIY